MTIRLDSDYTDNDVLSMRYRALQRHHADNDYPFAQETLYCRLCAQIEAYLDNCKSPDASWSVLCHQCVELAAEVETDYIRRDL